MLTRESTSSVTVLALIGLVLRLVLVQTRSLGRGSVGYEWWSHIGIVVISVPGTGTLSTGCMIKGDHCFHEDQAQLPNHERDSASVHQCQQYEVNP